MQLEEGHKKPVVAKKLGVDHRKPVAEKLVGVDHKLDPAFDLVLHTDSKNSYNSHLMMHPPTQINN